jgi:putative aminopeptidase FrvX
LDDGSLRFLEELSNAPGPAGYEREAMKVIKRRLDGLADMRTDRLGSLIYSRRGTDDGPVVLLPGHIDEIGFSIGSIDPDGFLSFNPLGYWWEQSLIGQRVKVLTRGGELRGVITTAFPFARESRPDKPLSMDGMCIDIGASSREEATAMGVRVGDAAVPDSRFFTVTRPRIRDGAKDGERTIAFGKALDNRIGAFLSAELVRHLAESGMKHPNVIAGAATVQEEIAAQGAMTVSHLVRPDVAIALDVDISGDVPGSSSKVAPTRMGEGVSITTWDPRMVPNQALKELCIDICERNDIPYQLSHARATTDAAVIHSSRFGVPSIVVGPSIRHMHSHVAVADLQDIDDTLRFLIELSMALDRDTVDSLTSIDGLRCGR